MSFFSFFFFHFYANHFIENDIFFSSLIEVHWPQYTNGNEGLRFSPLDDINKDNVQHLKVAWNFTKANDPDERFVHQSTPVFIDDGSGRGKKKKIFLFQSTIKRLNCPKNT